jgi:hypothetical protein
MTDNTEKRNEKMLIASEPPKEINKGVALKKYNIATTGNGVLAIISNLKNDVSYQKQLIKMTKLQKNVSKVERINKTIDGLVVYGAAKCPLFRAIDIGILSGASNIKIMIQRFEPCEKTRGIIEVKNKLGEIKCIEDDLLTKYGVYRSLFTSRSPLANLFRMFIYKIVDHMVENETDQLKIIANNIQQEHPKLAHDGIQDFDMNMEILRLKYEDQKRMVASEKSLKEEALENVTQLEITRSCQDMHITQMNIKKKEYIGKLSNKIYSDNAGIMDENAKLKQLFMKRVQIYIVDPTHVQKNHKDISFNKLDIDSCVQTWKSDYVDESDVGYFHIKFYNKVSDIKYHRHVESEWVVNKKHFESVKQELKQCNTFTHKSHDIFETTLFNIKSIIQCELVNV